MLWAMSNYGQQPPYGQNPYRQPPNPYGQQQPHATPPVRPGQAPYGQQPNPYSQQPAYGQPQAYPPQAQPYTGQWPPQAPARPELVRRSTVVVTMDAVPGRQIEEVLGDVIGVVARTRELRPDLRTGNPLDGYVTMLTESRQEAVARLVGMAENAGANAVVGLRFDCSEITQSLSEVAAYGTAVKLVSQQEQAADAGAGEQSIPATESGDQLEGAEDTIRNWPPPSSWPSNEPRQQTAGSEGDQP
jgi:uncharacterized protein YbjQ (UPF0145 family)